MRTSVKIELAMLFVLSIIMFIIITRSIVFMKSSNENQPKVGPKGVEGLKGDKGKLAAYSNSDYAFNRMVRHANKILQEYTTRKELEKNDFIEDHLKNLFIINKFKLISKSENITNNSSNLEYIVNLLENKVEEWINRILSYNQGYNFLTDKFQIEKSWNDLLSKSKISGEQEKGSPFNYIKQDEIWNW